MNVIAFDTLRSQHTLLKSWVSRSSTPVLHCPGTESLTVASGPWATRSSIWPQPGTARTVPPAIPRAQAYYWTSRWQAQERETLDEIRAGDFVRFNEADEAIQWLLADDEEDDSSQGHEAGLRS